MAKKQNSKMSKAMSGWQLFWYMLLTIVGFAVLRVILDATKWLLDIALIVGFVVVIIWLINAYWVSNYKPRR